MYLVKRTGAGSNQLGLLGNGTDSFLDRFFGGWPVSQVRGGLAMPAVDLAEKDSEFIIEAELPGLKDKDIELTVTSDLVTISGQKTAEDKAEDDSYYHVERRYGAFRREIHLPAPVNPDDVKATYDDGVLTVSLPKVNDSKARTVKITEHHPAPAGS